jgi:YHS domain-containing protein
MAFSVASKKSGKTYFLHGKEQELKGGHKVTLYYFAGAAGENALDKLPQGYVVSENTRTGLPILKKG